MIMSNLKTTCTLGLVTTGLMFLASSQAQAHRAVVVRHIVTSPQAVSPRHIPTEISRMEAGRIRHQVHEHKQLQRMAGADGVVTRREQARLNYDAAKVRALIHKAKTN
jgi:hypothetical protein